MAPEGDQAVFYHPWDVKALPPTAPWRPYMLKMVCTPPYDTRTVTLDTVGYGVGNAECGCGGGVWPPKVTKQCPAITGAWGHCPKAHGGPSCRRWCAPHRTTRIRAVEYGVGSAVHDCCGVLVAHSSSQAVEYTPQGPWALALVPLAGSTISSM